MDSEITPALCSPPPDPSEKQTVARCPVTGHWPPNIPVRNPVTMGHIIRVLTGRHKCEDPTCKCHRAEQYYGDVLHESIFRMIFSIARKYLTTVPEDLEDLAQICFERIVRKLDTYDEDRSEFPTWAWRVCENALRTRSNRYKRTRGMFVPIEDVTFAEPSTEDEQKLLTDIVDIHQAVAELKAKYPGKADILDEMFAEVNGRFTFHCIADVARATKREYNEVLKFHTVVVRPFFLNKLNSEVSCEQ